VTHIFVSSLRGYRLSAWTLCTRIAEHRDTVHQDRTNDVTCAECRKLALKYVVINGRKVRRPHVTREGEKECTLQLG
jgi:hypothetical protein